MTPAQFAAMPQPRYYIPTRFQAWRNRQQAYDQGRRLNERPVSPAPVRPDEP